MLDASSATSPLLVLLEPREVGLSGHGLLYRIVGGVPVTVAKLVLKHRLREWGKGGRKRGLKVKCYISVKNTISSEIHICDYTLRHASFMVLIDL